MATLASKNAVLISSLLEMCGNSYTHPPPATPETIKCKHDVYIFLKEDLSELLRVASNSI